jgi:hypothetical protein
MQDVADTVYALSDRFSEVLVLHTAETANAMMSADERQAVEQCGRHTCFTYCTGALKSSSLTFNPLATKASETRPRMAVSLQC